MHNNHDFISPSKNIGEQEKSVKNAVKMRGAIMKRNSIQASGTLINA